MGSKRPASTWSDEILADFQALSEKSETPALSSVRDVLMEKLLDDEEAKLKHVVVLVLTNSSPDLSLQVDNLPESTAMTTITARLSEGDSIPKCEATLLYAPVSKAAQQAAKKQHKKTIKNKIKKFKKNHDAMGPEFYVVPDSELVDVFAAVPFGSPCPDGYVETKPTPDGQPTAHALLAVDCEMCKTTKGVELTRVSIVDEQHNVLLDEYVLPSNPIVDYCTPYSGISADTLEGCTNSLASVRRIQARLLELIAAETILVGHSVENDLLALRLIHRRIIDTVLLYPHPKGPPFRSALRYLSSVYLKMEIQTGSDGHCSVEDATCTMKLTQVRLAIPSTSFTFKQLKIKKGPLFPDQAMDSQQRKLISELAHRKKSALIVDSAAACRNLAGSTAAAIPCTSPDHVFHHIRHQLTTGCPPTFTWGQALCPQDVAAVVRNISNDLPSQAMLLVVCCPPVDQLKALHKLRTTRGDPRCTLLWDKTQQDKLDAVAAATQRGRLLFVAKHG
ncbi:hypothetical protein AeRB84_019988 [Aphanomyces euteiches]|nr:hypothetical protein AeRB84_019988 [Aphanomyces euteiches]